MYALQLCTLYICDILVEIGIIISLKKKYIYIYIYNYILYIIIQALYIHI